MSTIGSFDLCRLCESACVSVVRCWSQNLTCFCSCCRLPPAHTALKHTLLQPDETNESSEPLPPAYKCSFSQSLSFPRAHTYVHSCSQAHAHSLTPLTPFARVFCMCFVKVPMCPNVRSPLPQDKVRVRGNYGVRNCLHLVLSSQMHFP